MNLVRFSSNKLSINLAVILNGYNKHSDIEAIDNNKKVANRCEYVICNVPLFLNKHIFYLYNVCCKRWITEEKELILCKRICWIWACMPSSAFVFLKYESAINFVYNLCLFREIEWLHLTKT